eukprot:1256023-Alexandrium_andersonii.AAC.1
MKRFQRVQFTLALLGSSGSIRNSVRSLLGARVIGYVLALAPYSRKDRTGRHIALKRGGLQFQPTSQQTGTRDEDMGHTTD